MRVGGNMRIFITIFIFYFTASIFSFVDNTISPCGIYEMEGVFSVTKKKNLRFILEHKSDSETIIELGKYKKTYPKNLKNVQAKVQIKITQECRYKCKGQFIKLVKIINPFDKPKGFFYPPKKPIEQVKCIVKKKKSK